MRRTLVPLVIVIATVGLLAVGCGGKKKELRPPKDLGKQEVVKSEPKNEPKWVGKPYREEKNFIYFTGTVAGVPDQSLGLRQAKAAAVQNLVESVKVKARSEFSEAVQGVNAPEASVGRYVDSVVAWTTDNVQVSGIMPVEQYTETVRTRTYSGYDYLYNCHVLVRLPKEEYFVARQGAAERAEREAPDEEARQLADDAKRKLATQP